MPNLIGGKKNVFFFEKPNNQKPKTKKMSFSSFANSQYVFAKFSGIGPWIGRIN